MPLPAWQAMLERAKRLPVKMERGIDRAANAASQGALIPTGPRSELGAYHAHNRAVRALLRESRAQAQPHKRQAPKRPAPSSKPQAARVTVSLLNQPGFLNVPRPKLPDTIGQSRIVTRNLNVTD